MNRIYPLEIKSIDSPEPGSFSGYVAIYNNVDWYNEMIMPGALDDSLGKHKNIFPLLWQHIPHEPIGTLFCRSDEKGIYVDGKICLETQAGREAYALLKMDPSPIQGMSIGFDTLDDSFEKNGLRRLNKIDLWEGSLVTFPANAEAIVSEVRDVIRLEQALEIIARATNDELVLMDRERLKNAKNVLSRVCDERDEVDKITEFVYNEVKEWMS